MGKGKSFAFEFKRKMLTGMLAAVTAVGVFGIGGYHIFAAEDGGKEASEYTQTYTDNENLAVGYDDLSDVLQKGGLGLSEDRTEGVASLASTYDSAALEERLVDGIRKWETEIDISDIGLTRADITAGAVRAVINSHPEIIGISGGYSYYYLGDTITSLVFSYLESAKQEQQELYDALDELDSEINTTGMSEEEIVLAYHEYLTSTVAYAYEAYLNDTLGGNHEYDMYGALVNHSSVCQGYAETMFYLLKKAGLPCAIASSSNINHAWNIVKLHGKWYHVDATWDDPVWDVPGRSNHDYFLVSFDTMNKNTLSNHTKDRTDMRVTAQWGDTYTSATDTTYESGMFWNGIKKVLYYRDGYWYSIGTGSSDTSYQINKYRYSTNTNQILYSGTTRWMAGSSSYYSGQFGSLYLNGSNLYFTTPDSLNKIDLSDSQVKVTEVVNIRSKYNYAAGYNLYGLGVQYGKVVYIVAKTPNFGYDQDASDSKKYNKNYDEYALDVCADHVWDVGVVVTAPTYTSTGIKKYTCENCGETKTETIAKLVCTTHAWDNGIVVTEPTYTTTGTKKYTCTNCGETKTETIAKLVCTEHAWNAGIVTIQPTYKTEGEKVYTCKNCGAVKTEPVDKLVCTDHVWDAGVVVTAPTYTSTGIKKYTCENCGETKTDVIGKLGCTNHVWDAGIVTIQPTYKTAGTRKYTCTNCGETKTETISKLVCTTHAWDNGTVTKKATYTATGIRKYTCKTCGAAKQVTIARLKLAKVTVKSAQQAGAIKLTWNKASGASGYKIYRRTGKGKYVCIKTVKSGTTSYIDKAVKSGTRYYYCVKAYTGNVFSEYTETSILHIKAPVVKVTKSAKGVKLTWKKSAGAKKYIVYRKTPAGKYRAVRTVTAKTLSWTDKTAKKGQTYYYTVKAVNNKTYSAASAQKRIKR